MSREIKFRFFDGKNFRFPEYLEIESNRFYDTWRDAENNTSIDNLVVMQYTGLKDKNGVEIYEGDILQTPRGDWGVVVWKSPFFEVTVSETQSSMYSREYFDEVEIIGNIHSNPELLNQ